MGRRSRGTFSASPCCGIIHLQFSASHLILSPRCCAVKSSTKLDQYVQVGFADYFFSTSIWLMRLLLNKGAKSRSQGKSEHRNAVDWKRFAYKHCQLFWIRRQSENWRSVCLDHRAGKMELTECRLVRNGVKITCLPDSSTAVEHPRVCTALAFCYSWLS